MDDKEKFNIAWKKIKERSEAIFGAGDEMTSAEADEILKAAEINGEELKRSAYDLLYRKAQCYWQAQKDPPPLLKKALADLRPDGLPPRTTSDAKRQAESTLSKFLSPFKSINTPQLSYSYRAKKNISTKDQSVLDELAKKLESRIQREKEEPDDQL